MLNKIIEELSLLMEDELDVSSWFRELLADIVGTGVVLVDFL